MRGKQSSEPAASTTAVTNPIAKKTAGVSQCWSLMFALDRLWAQGPGRQKTEADLMFEHKAKVPASCPEREIWKDALPIPLSSINISLPVLAPQPGYQCRHKMAGLMLFLSACHLPRSHYLPLLPEEKVLEGFQRSFALLIAARPGLHMYLRHSLMVLSVTLRHVVKKKKEAGDMTWLGELMSQSHFDCESNWHISSDLVWAQFFKLCEYWANKAWWGTSGMSGDDDAVSKTCPLVLRMSSYSPHDWCSESSANPGLT